MHASMSIEASAAYKPLQTAETKIMLRDILQNQDSPQLFPDFIRRYVFIYFSFCLLRVFGCLLSVRGGVLCIFVCREKRSDWMLTGVYTCRYAVSVVTVVAYGRRIKTLEDHLVVKQQKIDECEYPYTFK